MARGITEIDVHTAADEIVAAGERPTVERIRAHLGTGSPNTVTRWLESWWQQLGRRLAAQHAKLALPAAPAAIEALATQLWERALEAARNEALGGLDGAREELATQRAMLETERVRLHDDAQSQRLVAANAQQGQALAEARLREAERLIQQQLDRLNDVAGQRDALQTRWERLEHDHAKLRARLEEQEASAATERQALSQHVRSVEDRAHAEVDRARQEVKELRLQLVAAQRDHVAHEQAARQRAADTRAALADAQREAATQRSRAETLERQLSQLADLPATLQATLAKARDPAPPKRGVRRASKASPTKPRASSG